MKKMLISLLLLVLCAGCAAQKIDEALPEAAAKLLSEAGLSGEIAAYEESMKYLTGESCRYSLAGDSEEWISVYLYPDAKSAGADAACISADGFGYDDGKGHAIQIDWSAPPRYYQKDNIIFRYVGTDETVIDALTEAFGEPFAGGE